MHTDVERFQHGTPAHEVEPEKEKCPTHKEISLHEQHYANTTEQLEFLKMQIGDSGANLFKDISLHEQHYANTNEQLEFLKKQTGDSGAGLFSTVPKERLQWNCQICSLEVLMSQSSHECPRCGWERKQFKVQPNSRRSKNKGKGKGKGKDSDKEREEL